MFVGDLKTLDIDVQDPGVVVENFQHAAELCSNQPARTGGVIDLPARGRLLMTGGPARPQSQLPTHLKLAKLDKNLNHHVVLHEIVHGPGRVNGCDLSVRMLVQIASLKIAYPDQVHLMLANHDLAQMLGEGILKEGKSVVEAFELGLEFLYNEKRTKSARL